jgi:hypothetical protein
MCFMHSRYQLLPDEQVTKLYLGIHIASVEVAGPVGTYKVVEGNHFLTPPLGPIVQETGTQTTHRSRSKVGTSYLILGYADFAPGEKRLINRVEGPALTGKSTDKDIFGRLVVGDPKAAKCDKRFAYGFFFDD